MFDRFADGQSARDADASQLKPRRHANRRERSWDQDDEEQNENATEQTAWSDPGWLKPCDYPDFPDCINLASALRKPRRDCLSIDGSSPAVFSFVSGGASVPVSRFCPGAGSRVRSPHPGAQNKKRQIRRHLGCRQATPLAFLELRGRKPCEMQAFISSSQYSWRHKMCVPRHHVTLSKSSSDKPSGISPSDT